MEASAHRQAATRAQEVFASLRSCQLCPRDCRVDRLAGKIGYCGLDDRVHVFREMVHPAEEQGLNPSHQIYFSGCNIRCEYCSVIEWVKQPRLPDAWDLDGLVETVAHRRREGAVTLNLLGGEPAVSLQGVLQLLSRVPQDTKVVWNSNMYYSACVSQWLQGLVDVFLADLKCAASVCALRILRAEDYVRVARRRILEAIDMAETIIRVPVMPGHRACCLVPTLEWIADNASRAQVSIRADYVPPAPAHFAPAEYGSVDLRDDAIRLTERLGLQRIE